MDTAILAKKSITANQSLADIKTERADPGKENVPGNNPEEKKFGINELWKMRKKRRFGKVQRRII